MKRKWKTTKAETENDGWRDRRHRSAQKYVKRAEHKNERRETRLALREGRRGDG